METVLPKIQQQRQLDHQLHMLMNHPDLIENVHDMCMKYLLFHSVNRKELNDGSGVQPDKWNFITNSLYNYKRKINRVEEKEKKW